MIYPPKICVWEDDTAKTLICTVCKVPAEKGTPGLIRMCHTQQELNEFWGVSPPSKKSLTLPNSIPPLSRRVANFAIAYRNHIKAGRPKATQEQIDERFKICSTCPMLVNETCSHQDCGCSISSKQKFKNKLAWADQGCPEGKWRSLVEKPIVETKFVEASFCINLEKRKDRWQEFQRDYPKELPEITLYKAYEGTSKNKEMWWIGGPGAWGCYISHLKLLKHCVKNGIHSALIFEDDAVPSKHYSEYFQQTIDSLPDDWEWFYLGGGHHKYREYTPEKVNDHIYIPKHVYLTHAYAARGEGFVKLIRELEDKDQWRGWLNKHIDHYYAGVMKKKAINTYCAARWLFNQRSSLSNISNLYKTHGDRIDAVNIEASIKRT